MDVEYKKKLVELSLKSAEESQGSIRDLFLNQATRIIAEVDAYVSAELKAKKSSQKPKKICTHPSSSLAIRASNERTSTNYAVCTICWKTFASTEIKKSKWHGQSSVKKAPRGK